MRHWTLFDELREFQDETNRFFEDIYKRLSLFEMAMSRWYSLEDPVQVEYERRFERRVRGPAVTSESTHRYRTVETRPRMPMPEDTNHRQQYDHDRQPAVDYQRQPAVESRRQHALQPGSQHALPPDRQPAVDFSESATEVIARVNLPGLRRGDIEVTVSTDTLNISGKVNKSLALPPGIDPDKIRVSYRNGALEVRLPKEKRVNVNFE